MKYSAETLVSDTRMNRLLKPPTPLIPLQLMFIGAEGNLAILNISAIANLCLAGWIIYSEIKN